MTKASDLFIQCLEEEGVEYIFGVPGEENLDFLDSLSRSRKIKLVLTRHEQGAGFMAATYGRHTGHTGVCLATLGPGATNFVTAAAYAQLGGMPMMMITGQKPIKKSKQGRFQILDVVDMMRPITKYTHQLASADNIPSRVREAIRLAEEEKPGAVHLEFPEDIAEEKTESRPLKRSLVRRPLADESGPRRGQEDRGGALAGAGDRRRRQPQDDQPDAAPVHREDRHPVHHYPARQGRDRRDPPQVPRLRGLVVGRLRPQGGRGGRPGHQRRPRRDREAAFFMVNGGTEVIHVSTKTAEVDPVYFPQIEVTGDIANAMWQIKEDIVPSGTWNFDRMLRARQAEVEHTASMCGDMRFPIFPAYAVKRIRDAMPADGIICLDNGVYKIWFARNYPARMPNTVLLDNALATMGAGLPSAMASAMLYPDRKVMAICGDGGFMMNSQEMETAVRLGLNLTVLILRDDAYGMIRWKQANMGFEDFGLTYGNPDFVKYAESQLCQRPPRRQRRGASRPARPVPGLAGVHLIDCPVDYSENDRILFARSRS